MEEQLRKLIKEAEADSNDVLVQQLTQALNTVLASKREENKINTSGTLPREPAIEPVWGTGNNREWYLREEQEKAKENAIPKHTEEEKKEIGRQLEEAKKQVAEVLEWAKQQPNEPHFITPREETNIPKEEVKNLISEQKGEVTTIRTYSNGGFEIESKYTDLSSNSKNKELKLKLDSLRVSLAIDDVKNENNSMEDIHKIAAKYNTNLQDMFDIQDFLSKASSIGKVGEKVKAEYKAILEGKATEYSNSIINYFNDTFDKISNGINMLDMRLDEIGNKNTVDSNTYDEIINEYKKKLQEIEKLYDETFHTIDSKNELLLRETIKYLNETIKYCETYIKNIQDISKQAENRLDSLNI